MRTSDSSQSVRSLRFLVRWLPFLGHSSEQGLTLIESLVAIVVISITLVAITPPIFFATATRIQNRRAEQGLALAQGEVERVRTIVERGQYFDTDLPAPVTGALSNTNPAPPTTALTGLRKASNVDLRDTTASPPLCTEASPSAQPSLTQYVRVDVDGDCTADFLVQTFRTAGTSIQSTDNAGNTTNLSVGFTMGVRVYSVLAEANLKAGKAETTQASLRMTSGQGGFRLRPVSVLYSTVVKNSNSQGLSSYRELCKAGKC
ncbi:type II secretion system protein [Alkalinema sp. FACHB-956]|uniref:type II secretion system protein n=1 Tax=Alkalinema sp. FACHB-956 TaxID=2692768 RepID=UPI001688F2D9|nr:type II secretion system protein [Alkalinema sp. FACHB-956]MBD2327854.1 type II secretion system protein [Alkalinema sp. FACHB-956]